MKILLAVNSDIGRGNTIGTRFEKIYKKIKSKHRVFLLGRTNYSELKVKTLFYKNYLARGLNGLRMFVLPFLNFRDLDIFLFDRFTLKNIKNKDFDVAHLGEFIPRTIKYLQSRGVKVYLDIPIAMYENKLRQVWEAIRLADALIVPSPFVRDSVQKLNKNIKIVPFGADKKNIQKEYFKDGKLNYLFAGSVNKRKGMPILLRAWKELRLRNASLTICGRIYKEVKKDIKRYKTEDIYLKGFVKNMDKIWQKSDVFVFPSNLEGSAKAVYEAMSYSLPIITTYNAGSVVENSKEGFIIPVGDKEALKKKILFFFNNRDKVKEMGERARKKSEQYSWQKYAENIKNIYENSLFN